MIAQRAVAVLGRTAEALERSAVLADEDARRRAQNRRSQEAADEARAAERARQAAKRARLLATEAAN